MIERFVKVVGKAASSFVVPLSLVPIRLLTVCSLTACLMMAGVSRAQQPDPQATKPVATQENPEVETPARKVKPRQYRNWTFNVGGGLNLPHGQTNTFVRGGGPVADAAVARNFSKYFGFRLDASWTDLPLRTSALRLAEAPSGTNQVYGAGLDPIIYIPATKLYSGFVFIGPGFYHRSGKLDSTTTVPGSACNAFWDWWGTCLNGSVPLGGTFLKESQNELGFNYGGGIARKVTGHIDLYAEYRALHGSHNNNTTDARTLTLGVRW
jgi:opacity protein-like surface antigen